MSLAKDTDQSFAGVRAASAPAAAPQAGGRVLSLPCPPAQADELLPEVARFLDWLIDQAFEEALKACT
jgi:hypothetical protein